MSRDVRLGWTPFLYAFAILGYASLCVYWAATGSAAPVNLHELTEGGLGAAPLTTNPDEGLPLGICQLLLALVAFATLRRGRRLQAGTTGRMRTIVSAGFGLAYVTLIWVGGLQAALSSDIEFLDGFLTGIASASNITSVPHGAASSPAIKWMAWAMLLLSVLMTVGTW